MGVQMQRMNVRHLQNFPGDKMDSSQSHVENPQSETRFIRQSRSKPSITGTLMEVPPTRSQQEAEAQTIVEPEQGLKVSHLYIHWVNFYKDSITVYHLQLLSRLCLNGTHIF